MNSNDRRNDWKCNRKILNKLNLIIFSTEVILIWIFLFHFLLLNIWSEMCQLINIWFRCFLAIKNAKIVLKDFTWQYKMYVVVNKNTNKKKTKKKRNNLHSGHNTKPIQSFKQTFQIIRGILNNSFRWQGKCFTCATFFVLGSHSSLWVYFPYPNCSRSLFYLVENGIYQILQKYARVVDNFTSFKLGT